MKTIGIITIVKVNNYGAELQAFALQRKLNLMGYKAEIIDYLFYKNKEFKKEKISRPYYNFPLKKRIKEFLLPIIEEMKSLPHYKNYQNRIREFERFHNKYTRFSPVRYYSYSQLYTSPPVYDVYCVGSDQVWNPNCYTSLNPYFLTFAPKSSKKIAYASSFGVKNLPNDAKNTYKENLGQLTHISTREKTGIKIIKDLTGREAKLVLDPTFLLTQEEWNEIANCSKVPNYKYILLYVLKDSKFITKTAMELSKLSGLKIVRITKGAFKQDYNKHIYDIIDAAPDDFIGLFSKADLILTNSFHGTVFSIIYQKDFYTILKKDKDNNSRQIDLLNNLGLGNRIVYEGNFLQQPSIDYKISNTRTEKLRHQSLEYLINAIEN